VICTALSMEALSHTKLLDCADEIIQKPVRLEKISQVIRKYVPEKNQQRTLFSAKPERNSPEVLEACRALRKVQQTIKGESPTGRLLDMLNLPDCLIYEKP
jgi:predicted CopG family antitoxin